jgi:O-antigen/teichoic acid export membrane protein
LNTNSLLKDSLYSFGTNVASIPLSFVITVLLARTLGPGGKGGYDLFVATGGLLMMVFGFSLPSGIIYVVALSSVSLRAMIRWLFLMALAQGLLVLSLLSIAERSEFIWKFLPQSGGRSIIVLIAVYIWLTALNSYWRAILIGRQEIIAANRITLLTRITDVFLFLLLLGILWLIDRPLDLRMIIGILLASGLISNVLLLQRLHIVFKSSPPGTSGFHQVVGYSAPCYLGNLVQFLNYRLDVFLVSALIDQRAVGLYALSVSLAQVVWLFSNSVATVLLPKVASQQELATQNANLSAQATRLSFWASLIAGTFLSLLVIIALPMIYGEAFRNSIAPLLWLMPGIVAISPAFVLASYIAGIGKPQINLFVALIGVFFTAALDLLLIPEFNIVGAALASSVSYSIIAFLTVLYFKRESKIFIRDIFLITSEDIRLAISMTWSVVQETRFQKTN